MFLNGFEWLIKWNNPDECKDNKKMFLIEINSMKWKGLEIVLQYWNRIIFQYIKNELFRVHDFEIDINRGRIMWQIFSKDYIIIMCNIFPKPTIHVRISILNLQIFISKEYKLLIRWNIPTTCPCILFLRFRYKRKGTRTHQSISSQTI